MVFLSAFAVALALSTEARAEDWSQFIDNTPQKPLTHVSGPSKPAPAPRATKAVAKKPKATAKVAARAKKRK